MKKEIPFETIVAIAQILLPQGGSKDDMLKVLGIAEKVAHNLPMLDILWLLTKAIEGEEKGGEE